MDSTTGRGSSPRTRRRRGSNSRTRDSWRHEVGAGSLALTLAGSALAFGGQHTWVIVLSAATAALAALLLPLPRTPRTVLVIVALAAYTLLQLLPLPFGLVATLSPHSADVWRGALVPFGEPAPRWVTLSVDPAATALEALKWGAYACILSAALGLRSRHGSESIAWIVGGSALLVSMVTLVHGILDLPRIYGVFLPTDPSPWVRGPFVNGNNLSGYLNLGAFALAGLWISRRSRNTRVALAAGALLLAVGSLLAGSRAGTAALLLGVPLFGYLSGRTRFSTAAPIALASASVVGIALTAVLGGPRIWETLADTHARTKVSAWRWTLDLISDFPIFGAGRGAFETAFMPYRRTLGHDWTMVFAHAESFPLEWAADWGIPVALMACAALALATRRLLRRGALSPIAAGLATGLAALVVQNFFDLGLELFAIMAAAISAFAATCPPVELPTAKQKLSLPMVITGVATAVTLAMHAAPVQVERRAASNEYRGLAKAFPASLRAFQSALEPYVRRHPGEAYFPLLGGLAAMRLGTDALPWLGRALERSPLDAQVHLALSEALAARNARGQAALHARLAALYDVTLRERALRELGKLVDSPTTLAEAFPEHLPGEELLAGLCPWVRRDLVLECWHEAARRPVSTDANRELAAALLDAIERGEPPCAGPAASHCADEAALALGRLHDASTAAQWRTATIRARLLAWRGDATAAVQVLLDRCPATAEAAACCERALELAAHAKSPGSVSAIATRYLATRCGEPAECAAANERLGRVYQDLGASGLALHHFTDAARQNPTAERWVLTAEAALAAGSRIAARLAIEHASREGLNGPEQQARVQNVETRLAADSSD